MISKNTVKFIKSLQIKKYRQKENVFLVEGAKNVLELVKSGFNIHQLYLTEDFLQKNSNVLPENSIPIHIINEDELTKVGSYKTNNAALAIVEMQHEQNISFGKDEYGLVLDDIRDPGNLGTIIRVADWYGIRKIICSENSADRYNPKVIAATMGSFTRVKISYQVLTTYLPNLAMPILGTYLEGENVHQFKFPKTGLILIGNESTGISRPLEKLVSHKLNIPRFGGAESLNAGVATAVICDNLRRV